MFRTPGLLQALLGRMLDGVSIINAQRRQVYVNDAFCEMVGFHRDELLGQSPPYPYWPPEELPAIQAAFERVLNGEVGSFELVFGSKDGARIEVLLAPSEVRDEHGVLLGYIATVKDVSERKRLERSLADSEERWRSIAETPFDFVVVIDRDYRYRYVNHTAPGIAIESLIGIATPFDFVDPAYHEAMRAVFDTAFTTGRPGTYDVYVPQIDGWYSSIVGPIAKNGVVTGLSILTRDITEQKRAEEALRRSEHRLREAHKMKTIGTLAGGIAHDLNNILTPILAYTDLAGRELPADHEVSPYLNGIRVSGQRARDLVQRILLFSRQQEPKKTTFDLRDLVSEDIALLRASLPANVELVTQLPTERVPVHADRSQLGQVVTNLATNALQAMQQQGGTLTIRLELVTVGERTALLSVADTGPGIDPETLGRVFEPFFSTKPVGAGTGLGLSIVDSVVREHGGDAEVRSVPGSGTVVTVRLPAPELRLMPQESVAAMEGGGPRRLRVLVVDDEVAVAAVAKRALESVGHHVTTASSPQLALELFARDPDAFDAVLTDQSMPLMSGTSMVERLLAVRPSLPWMLMTGLGDETTQSRARSLNVMEIIDKPFSLATLLQAMERVVPPRH